jgi:hypothetical protein
MIGCILIALGTLIVASKGTLSRTGLPEETFALAMAVGVAIIFAGYLQTRRPGRQVVPQGSQVEESNAAAAPNAMIAPRRAGVIALPQSRRERPGPGTDPAIAFIEERFLPLDDAALDQLATTWSVPRTFAGAFDRLEARLAWALRLRLSVGGQAAFDTHTPAAQLQLALLYHEVFAPGLDAIELSVAGG